MTKILKSVSLQTWERMSGKSEGYIYKYVKFKVRDQVDMDLEGQVWIQIWEQVKDHIKEQVSQDVS